jgi:hypothetical protein
MSFSLKIDFVISELIWNKTTSLIELEVVLGQSFKLVLVFLSSHCSVLGLPTSFPFCHI